MKIPQRGFFFDKEEHDYYWDGKMMTGVTTVLKVIAKPALIQWAANEAVKYIETNIEIEEDRGPSMWIKSIMIEDWEKLLEEARTAHRRKKEDAGEKGTDIHSILEDIIKDAIKTNNGKIALTSHENQQIQNFLNWSIENKIKFLDSEVQIYDKDLFYAGTLDFVAEIGDKKYLGDIKTGSGIYPEYFYQTAAYRHAWEKMGKEKLDGSVIVNITKKGELKVEYSYFFKEDFEAFAAALVIYRRQNNKVQN